MGGLSKRRIDMHIDHIFIFSQNKGEEADELVKLGLTEGSSRIHPGQGTKNRKFYFENFFLEILWVSNELEILDERTLPTRLWERANFQKNHISPFGLCLINDEHTDKIFTDALAYQPLYFPQGMPIEVLTHQEEENLPWTFRLPFKGKLRKSDEPRTHPLGINQLTAASFGVKDLISSSPFLLNSEKLEGLNFSQAAKNTLTLEFDHGKQQQQVFIESLQLAITY